MGSLQAKRQETWWKGVLLRATPSRAQLAPGRRPASAERMNARGPQGRMNKRMNGNVGTKCCCAKERGNLPRPRDHRLSQKRPWPFSLASGHPCRLPVQLGASTGRSPCPQAQAHEGRGRLPLSQPLADGLRLPGLDWPVWSGRCWEALPVESGGRQRHYGASVAWALFPAASVDPPFQLVLTSFL